MQKALFDLLESDVKLSPLFSQATGPRAQLPRLEFDFLQTTAEEVEGVFRHRFQFSVWSDLHNYNPGDQIVRLLHTLFHHARPQLEEASVILMQFEKTLVSKDRATRLTHHEITFAALTQK